MSNNSRFHEEIKPITIKSFTGFRIPFIGLVIRRKEHLHKIGKIVRFRPGYPPSDKQMAFLICDCHDYVFTRPLEGLNVETK